MLNIRQAIQMDSQHLQDIFALPCVESIHKQRSNNTAYAAVYNTSDKRTEYAFPDWWICEIDNGYRPYWTTMSDHVYRDNIKAQAAMQHATIKAMREEVEK